MSAANAAIRAVGIVGAGIGGLSLAQLLRISAPHIAVRLFDRDVSADGRSQGYYLGLNPATIRTLSPVGERVPRIRHELTAHSLPGFAMTDAAGNTLMSAAAGGAFVDRSAFRQALLTDMDVTWGKRFSRYTQEADGVTLHFADGKEEVVDLLIAGDGANSTVRRQRAPAIKYDDLGFTNVAGIAALADVPRVIQEKALAGLTRWLGPDGHTVMMFGVRDLGLLGWVVSWPGAQDAWRAEFASAGEDVEDEYSRSSQARDKLQAAMVARVRDRFQPEVAQVVAATLPAGTSLYGPRQIFSVDPKDIPSQLAHGPQERVYLLGDAAHATTTHRGLGANTAIQDAADLAAALSTQKPSWHEALQAYERGMVTRGVRVATESRQSTQMIHATGPFATYVRPSMIRLFGMAMRAGLIKQE